MRFAAGALLVLGVLASTPAFAQASPSNYTTGYRYDADRRVTGTISPDPDGSGALHYAAVRNTYNSAGELVTVEKGELSSWKSESIAPSAWGSAFSVQSTQTTAYDSMGRKAKETLTGTTGGVTSITVTQYSYDYLGQLQCTAERMNAAVYGSLPASACSLSNQGTDGPDRITKNTYDAAGRLTLVQKAYGTADQANYATYTWTANSKQASLTDADGNLATMTYDGFDRQTKWTFPSKTTAGQPSTTDFETYTYDPNDNRATLTKRDGRIIRYWYDALNRVTNKCVVASVTGTCTTQSATTGRNVYYGYDAEGHQTSALFDSATGSDGITNTYDGFGELLTSTISMSGFSKTLTSAYDCDGNRIRLIHPEATSSFVFTYGYDGLDRLGSVYEHGSVSSTCAGTVSGTALLDTFTYNPAELVSNRAEGATGASSVAYTWDGIGRLAIQGDSFSGDTGNVSWTLGYNAGSQITSDGRSNSAYVFPTSQIGNVNRNYAVNGLNQYTTAGTATFGYDNNANLISDGTWTYTYDVENRLVAAVAGTTTVNLTYDPAGRLFEVAKLVGGTTTNDTRFVYDSDAMVLEYDGSGAVTNRYVHGSNAAADDPLVWYAGHLFASPSWLHADHLGSIVALTDINGANPTINTYDEYGIKGSGNNTAERFGYTGQAYIPELDLYYYKARFYSPSLGRFLQTDPIGYTGGVNLYGYVSDDPTDETDPSGNVAAGSSMDDCSDPTCHPILGDHAKHSNVSGGPMNGQHATLADFTSSNSPLAGFDRAYYGGYYTQTGLFEYEWHSDALELGSTMAGFSAGVLSGAALEDLAAIKLGSAAAEGAEGLTATTEGAFSHSYSYDAKVLNRALEDPVSHNFPYSFDDEILATNPISKPNGYNIFQQPGSMNGTSGSFEIGVTNDGVIDHRFFRPGP